MVIAAIARVPVRERLIALSERPHDAPRDPVLRRLGRAMLGNVALALDLPPEYRSAD